jgi:hypothetical protein
MIDVKGEEERENENVCWQHHPNRNLFSSSVFKSRQWPAVQELNLCRLSLTGLKMIVANIKSFNTHRK